jgi:hypothetical protein
MTIPPDDGPRPQRQVRRSIGLWGAPGSGKTTFLGALYLAANRSGGNVTIVGENHESTLFLSDSYQQLARERRFPDATQGSTPLSWQVRVGRPGGGPAAKGGAPVTFSVDLVDAPGRVHDAVAGRLPDDQDLAFPVPEPSGSGAQSVISREEMLDYLASCRGLLLMVDPVQERGAEDTGEYFHGTMLEIAERWTSENRGSDQLPHFVAVCITKFDHPEVYGFARKHSFRTYREDDQYKFPRIHSGDAMEFYRELGRSVGDGEADLICNALRHHFRPERVQFFVTSAIGFYCDGTRFREDDRDNICQEGDGTNTIRGPIYPINVLEPIVWLGRNIVAG